MNYFNHHLKQGTNRDVK